MRRISAVLFVLPALACDPAVDRPDDTTAEVKPLAWSDADNPALFGPQLEYRLAELPLQGAADVAPWAGNYWPTYQDNINYRWAGPESQSPAAKFGEAFGVEGVEEAVSKHHGIEKNADRTACTTNEECNADIGETCARRTGAESGRCIPTWWGICHAWAPAAMLFAEPKHAVEWNGVTMKVQDIKALLTLANEDVGTRFVSTRCNDDDSQDRITYDEYGRPAVDGPCIDTNPATYHLLLANYLGIRKQSFVEDRTFDDEVWNQPLRAYRVKRLDEITGARANTLVGVRGEDGTSENFEGDAARNVWTHFGPFPVAAGAAVRAVMSGDNDADLYVRFGAAPTTRSYDCRPYANGSDETCEYEAAAAGEVHVSVRGYAASSAFRLVVEAGGGAPSAYLFNADAAKLYHVELEVDFIAESPAGTDGNLSGSIDRYTHTDRYSYVLEADAEGRLLGGEWLGDSKRAHPDFLWLPTSTHNASPIAGGKIAHHQVLELYRASIDERVTPEAFSGSVSARRWRHFGPFDTAAGTLFTARVTGTGDPDLYVRRGARPTGNDHDCRPYRDGSDELCAMPGGGEIYVSLYGYSTSNFNLAIGRVAAVPVHPPAELEHLDASGDLAQGAWARYQVTVTAGQKLVVRTDAPNDVDLYTRFGAAPTTATFDARPYTASGNEEVAFTATTDGVLHIGVHGYAASSFQVRTLDN